MYKVEVDGAGCFNFSLHQCFYFSVQDHAPTNRTFIKTVLSNSLFLLPHYNACHNLPCIVKLMDDKTFLKTTYFATYFFTLVSRFVIVVRFDNVPLPSSVAACQYMSVFDSAMFIFRYLNNLPKLLQLYIVFFKFLSHPIDEDVKLETILLAY